MDDLLAGKTCETCGEPAACGIVDMIDGGWQTDGRGERYWSRFSGEHSTHYFCAFHERAGRVHPRGTQPVPTRG